MTTRPVCNTSQPHFRETANRILRDTTPRRTGMSCHRLRDEDLQFEDLFDDAGHVQEDECLSPMDTTTTDMSPGGEQDRGVSALTMTLNQMHFDDAPPTMDATDDLGREVERKWTTIHARHDNPDRMGASAPVWIPQRRMTWTADQYDRLEEINETVERPLIQFSLNSGIAEKRAKLKTREKILNMTGVTEEHPVANTLGFRIPSGRDRNRVQSSVDADEALRSSAA